MDTEEALFIIQDKIAKLGETGYYDTQLNDAFTTLRTEFGRIRQDMIILDGRVKELISLANSDTEVVNLKS